MSAYFFFEVTVLNPEGMTLYKNNVEATLKKYGGNIVVQGAQAVPVELDAPEGRIIVVKFESTEAAKEWYHSSEYQEILPSRLNASETRAWIVQGV